MRSTHSHQVHCKKKPSAICESFSCLCTFWPSDPLCPLRLSTHYNQEPFWVWLFLSFNLCSVMLSTEHDDNSTLLRTIGNKCGLSWNAKIEMFSFLFLVSVSFVGSCFLFLFIVPRTVIWRLASFWAKLMLVKIVTSNISSWFF